jgi:hypothetical protein
MVVGLPLLDAMLPRGASAAPSPRRFVVYAHPLGTLGEWFWPVPPGGTPWTYAHPMGRATTFRTGTSPLDVPLSTLSPILTPLQAHRGEMLLVENLDNTTGNHGGYGAMLTGHPLAGDLGGGISIDQELARQIGKDSKFPSLQLGIKSTKQVGKLATVSWYGAGKGAAPENNPRAVFDRVFSDVRTDPMQANAFLAQRRSVLDAALSQATSVRARLGAEDRKKVDNYLESFRSVEKRLAVTVSAGCTKPQPPGAAFDAVEQLPATTRTQIDLLVLALACDLTRVATIQMSNEANNLVFTFLGNKGRWHDLSHTTTRGGGWEALMDEYVRVNKWNTEMIAYLVGRLKEMNLMSTTLVLWVNPMNNGQIHNSSNLPTALFGSLGYFKQGRHVRLPAAGKGENRYLNDLYTSILHAFGIAAGGFGDATRSRGAIAEIKA